MNRPLIVALVLVLQPSLETMAQNSGVESLSSGISLDERPRFGRRPTGVGFRPAASAGRTGLLGPRGLLDAMSQSRQNPLFGNVIQSSLPARNPLLDRAIQVLRTRQQALSRQVSNQSERGSVRRSSRSTYSVSIARSLRQSTTSAVDLNRLIDITRSGGFEHVTITSPEAGLVLLKGTVANKSRRRIIEYLVRMDPGVRSIDNQVLVPSG